MNIIESTTMERRYTFGLLVISKIIIYLDSTHFSESHLIELSTRLSVFLHKHTLTKQK